MKKCKIINHLLSILVLVMVLTGFSVVNAQAAPSNAKVMKAYKAFLTNRIAKEDTDFEKFDIIDIDRNGVKELIHYTSDGKYHVYTYKNGKVRKIKTCDGESMYPIYYNRKMRVFVSWSGGNHDGSHIVYQMKNGKIKRIKSIDQRCNYDGLTAGDSTYSYYIGNKKISEKKYKQIYLNYIVSYKNGRNGLDLTTKNVLKKCK